MCMFVLSLMIGEKIMAREKLYVTVPSLFRCPISMDVMRSPVSLCTGVTYDRSSIQHWLDSGHDTCPATMQVLSSKDFIPNLTLHRLIQNLKLSPSHSSPCKISTEQVKSLIHGLHHQNNDHISDSLSKIIEFLSYSDENRIFLSNFPEFDSLIVRVLVKEGSHVEISEMVIRVLSLIIQEENGIKERVRRLIFDANRDCISSIVSIFQNAKSQISKVESARFLELLAGEFQSNRSIAESPGLMSVLVHLLRVENKDNKSSELNDAVLSLLISVSTTQSTKTELVRFGLVPILTKSIQNQPSSTTTVSSNSTNENSLRLLAMLSTCAAGRRAIAEEPGCVEAVTERLVKASKAETEDAVVVLWGLCCGNSRNGKVQEKVVMSNGVMKILLVLQRDCEDHVRKMCGDLVKVLRMVSKDGLSSYETKTTHIKPC